MKFVPVLALLLGCSAPPELQRVRPEDAIRAWNFAFETEPLSRVEVIGIPGRNGLYAAILDHQLEWSGTFGVYHVSEGAVDWQAEVREEPLEQAVYRIRCFSWDKSQWPVVEVLGISHMGNGCLYLYELRDRQLELLLRTVAVDFNPNPDRFRDGVLEITYERGRPPFSPDVLLTGEREELAEQEEKVLRSFPCRKRFSWDPSSQQYREVISERVGFPEDSQ